MRLNWYFLYIIGRKPISIFSKIWKYNIIHVDWDLYQMCWAGFYPLSYNWSKLREANLDLREACLQHSLKVGCVESSHPTQSYWNMWNCHKSYSTDLCFGDTEFSLFFALADTKAMQKEIQSPKLFYFTSKKGQRSLLLELQYTRLSSWRSKFISHMPQYFVHLEMKSYTVRFSH